MATYGPATGHYSSQSIRTAKKTGGNGGATLKKNSLNGNWDYTPDPLGIQKDPSIDSYGNYSYAGSSSGMSSDYDSLLSAYEKRQAEILKKQQEALQSEINNNVSNLEAQKASVNANYDDAARQAYITKMQNQKALPEQLAAQGHNGGMSETANLSIGANYQNNLANINNSRNEALNGIDTEINNVKSAGSIEAAQLAANSAQSALDVYLQLAQQKIAEQQQAQAEAKSEFANTIGAYSDDYMKEIQRIQKSIAAGDSSESWKIPYLTAARNEKIAAQQAAVAEAQQQDFENQLNLAKANAYIYNQYN